MHFRRQQLLLQPLLCLSAIYIFIKEPSWSYTQGQLGRSDHQAPPLFVISNYSWIYGLLFSFNTLNRSDSIAGISQSWFLWKHITASLPFQVLLFLRLLDEKVTFNPDQQKDKETKAKGKTNKAQNREQTQNGILKTLYLLFKGLKGLVPFQRKLCAGENEDDLERNSPFPYSWFV